MLILLLASEFDLKWVMAQVGHADSKMMAGQRPQTPFPAPSEARSNLRIRREIRR